jgi:hypothetical protein
VSRDRAAAWAVGQFGADDLIAASFDPSLDDPGGTAYAASNLMATGSGRAQARAAVDALAGRVDDYVVDAGGDDLPGSLARLIIAVESVGRNPRAFGGTDLVARLEATIQPSGLVGVQDATYDGSFRQGLALAALSLVQPKPASIRAGDGPVRNRPVVRWLRDQQCADGSWMPLRTDLSEPCAYDPVTYSGPDTNSTAMAVLGLRAVGASTRTDAGAWFAAVRGSDGGWSYDGGRSTASDPDSTGLVLAAREALGLGIDQRGFERLASFQFGPSAQAGQRGAFWYPPFDGGDPAPSLFATNDALLALAPGVWPAAVERCTTTC